MLAEVPFARLKGHHNLPQYDDKSDVEKKHYISKILVTSGCLYETPFIEKLQTNL